MASGLTDFFTGLPGSKGVISGMRQDCNIHIYIDVHKAMDGKTLKNTLELNEASFFGSAR